MSFIGPMLTFLSGIALIIEWCYIGGEWRLAGGVSFIVIAPLVAIHIHRRKRA